MKLTPLQISAAIALTGMNQFEVAQFCGVGRTTLNKTLNSATTPDDETLDRIRTGLEKLGIEFLDNEGVRRRLEGVDVLNGVSGLSKFLDEIYNYLKENGGTISVTGVDEKQWIEAHGEENSKSHFARMDALLEERKDVRIKSLTRDGLYPNSTSSYTEYRWISKDRFSTVPFYVCGDMLGIIIFQSSPPPKIILIRSGVVVDAYQRQFDELWDGAKELPPQRA